MPGIANSTYSLSLVLVINWLTFCFTVCIIFLLLLLLRLCNMSHYVLSCRSCCTWIIHLLEYCTASRPNLTFRILLIWVLKLLINRNWYKRRIGIDQDFIGTRATTSGSKNKCQFPLLGSLNRAEEWYGWSAHFLGGTVVQESCTVPAFAPGTSEVGVGF